LNLDFSEDETKRLSSLLDSAPGPAMLDSKYYPNLTRPDGTDWVWSKEGHLTTLVGKNDSQIYLALGFYCYVKRSSIIRDRLIEWHEIRNDKHVPQALQLNLINTGLLTPISQEVLDEKAPIDARDKKRNTNGLIVSSAPESIELPANLPVGKSDFHFPSEMKKSEGELLFLINSTSESMKGSKGKPDPRGIYVADLSNDKVHAVKMDWWNDADFDFGWQWISKVIRDPVTGNIIGTGVRAPSFVIEAGSYRYLGTWSQTRYEKFIYTSPDGKERVGLENEVGKWMEEDLKRYGKTMNGAGIRPYGSPLLTKDWKVLPDHYKTVAKEITSLLEAAMSGKKEVDLGPVAVGGYFDKEAIFAWTFYFARKGPLSLEDFLPIYDAINKDVPTAKEVVWGFSRLVKRGWLSKQGNLYSLTNLGSAKIENIVGEGDFWDRFKRLKEWFQSHTA
jgi:hypothetical protein